MSASLKRRFAKKIQKAGSDDCWNWTAKAVAKYGYGRMTAGRGRYLRSHQVAWALENGPIPENLIVRHLCNNTKCCNPKHLSIGTVKDNVGDMIASGRNSLPPRMAGEGHPGSKLAKEDVEEIRSSNSTLRAMADKFGVSTKSVWRVRAGLSWKS